VLPPANPDTEQAVMEAIVEHEAKLTLNPQLARHFLGPIYDTFFAPTTGGHLLMGGVE